MVPSVFSDDGASLCARRLLELLAFRLEPRMLLFEPRPTLAESSVTVAPVSGGEADEDSCLVFEDLLDGTFKREFFCCGFSGTVGGDCATDSLLGEVDGPASDVGCSRGSTFVVGAEG